MPKGGPRPNSGPPVDNLNALKHGRNASPFLPCHPPLDSLLPRLRTLTRLTKGRKNAHSADTNPSIERSASYVERRTINKSDTNAPAAVYAANPKAKKPHPNNQTPYLAPPPLSIPRYEKPLDRSYP